MINFKKKKETPGIISTQSSNVMQKFKPGSYLSSCSLTDSASSSSSSIQGVCNKGKGAPAIKGVKKHSMGDYNIGTLFATKQTLNCRNTFTKYKLPVCSKTTGAKVSLPVVQITGGIPQYSGTLEDYSRQPADPRGPSTSN